jgi:ribosomal protein L40E
MKGGCGCLTLFGIMAFFAILARGRVHVSFFGLLFIFLIGGVIGRILFSSYEKGQKEAGGKNEPPLYPTSSGEVSTASSEAPPIRDYVHEATTCVQCGMTIPPGATACSRCGWTYKEQG